MKVGGIAINGHLYEPSEESYGALELIDVDLTGLDPECFLDDELSDDESARVCVIASSLGHVDDAA